MYEMERGSIEEGTEIKSYYEHFYEFWIPIYRQQIFKAKFNDDLQALIEIKENIYKNWHLTHEEALKIIKELGIYWIVKGE